MTTVNAITCPKCGDMIFSRARHDFRSCSCGTVHIDGGFDYVKISFDPYDPPEIKKLISHKHQKNYIMIGTQKKINLEKLYL